MGTLRVIDGGMFTTIQDMGRIGFRNIGVPNSGAMDPRSARWANKLVNNPEDTPVLEMTIKGGKYQFDKPAIIALTGAEMHATVNDFEAPLNESLMVNSGDELELGFTHRGCRTYLAIRGTLQLDKMMNSYSTLVSAGFGGLEGRPLKAGDTLSWGDKGNAFILKKMPDNEIPYFSSKVTVEVMPGSEWNWLTSEEQEQFLNQKWEVSPNSNRMGIRIQGTPLQVPGRQMISSPVIPGIIQLPAGGNPIILMNDGQTIGGYPRIAKVADRDLWRLGQLKPGDSVRFNWHE